MPATPSPLHDKPVPKKVSKPTPAAEAAAVVAESTVAPARAAGRKARPAAGKSAGKKSPAGKSAAKPASGKPAGRAGAPVKTKAAGKTNAKAHAAPEPAVATKAAKAHKPKLVRDSFTIPKDEYQVLDALKSRALGLEQHVRKSELLRAGIRALNAMSDRAFLAAIDAVPTLKTGRPKKG
jgi:hypothetical protein